MLGSPVAFGVCVLADRFELLAISKLSILVSATYRTAMPEFMSQGIHNWGNQIGTSIEMRCKEYIKFFIVLVPKMG